METFKRTIRTRDCFCFVRVQRQTGAVVAVQSLRPYVSQSAEVRSVNFSVGGILRLYICRNLQIIWNRGQEDVFVFVL